MIILIILYFWLIPVTTKNLCMKGTSHLADSAQIWQALNFSLNIVNAVQWLSCGTVLAGSTKIWRLEIVTFGCVGCTTWWGTKIRKASHSEIIWSHCVIEEVISGNFDFYFSQLGFMFTWSTWEAPIAISSNLKSSISDKSCKLLSEHSIYQICYTVRASL